MSVQQIGPGKWRATVTVPGSGGKRKSAADVLGLGRVSFATKKAAERAERDAESALAERAGMTEMSVRTWWERWTTDPLFARKKDSTMIHYRRMTEAFVCEHGALKLGEVTPKTVSQWLAGGKRTWTVSGLRVMFSDAASPRGGCLIPSNPFRGLGISVSDGNANVDPPSEEMLGRLIEACREIGAPPGFAAWLQFGAWSGARPGESDALLWENIDLERNRVQILRQLNGTTDRFSAPKNGRPREIVLFPQARAALLAVRGQSDAYCFVNGNGDHWRKAARQFWFRKLAKHTAYSGTIYLATRHFMGHYLYETMQQKAEDVAAQLGHRDQGKLVRELYGHHNVPAALDRLEGAVPMLAPDLRRVA